MTSTTINQKHQRFADEYLLDFNGAEAYIRAGYKATGNAVHVGASKLLAREDVQQYLQQRKQELQASVGVSQEDVLKRLIALALGDIRQLFDEKGNFKEVHALSQEEASMIQGIEVFEEFAGRGEDRVSIGYTKKIKFVPRMDPLRLLGQHMGMFAKKVEVTGPGGKPVQHEHNVVEELLSMVEGADTGLGKSRGRRAGSDAP
jgi:phage terminase small subunit